MSEAQTVESETVDVATVDVATAAVVLGVNKQTVYEAIKRGDQPFPVIRLGDRILIPRTALERLVGIDLDAARAHLREELGGPIEIEDPHVLDAAAAVIVNGRRSP